MNVNWWCKTLFLACITCLYPISAHALLITSQPGNLIIEALAGHGATSNQEFGLGTPSISSTAAERDVIFTIHLVNEQIGSVTPSPIVDKGFLAAGTVLDFYNISDFGGLHFAFSSTLGLSPSPSDLVVFTDIDNSLGFGGSVVETIGIDDWVLHLDDAASICCDDDDNEMIIRVRIEPAVINIPEPASFGMFAAGLVMLIMVARRTRWL